MISLIILLALGQNTGQVTIVQAPASPAQAPPLQTSMGPVQYALGAHHDLHVSTLGNDTLVVVKDVGDSQIVMIYRVDAAHKVQLLHKARFFY